MLTKPQGRINGHEGIAKHRVVADAAVLSREEQLTRERPSVIGVTFMVAAATFTGALDDLGDSRRFREG